MLIAAMFDAAQTTTISLPAAIFAGLLTIGFGAVVNWATSKAAAARFEGSIQATVTEKFKSYDQKFDGLERVDRDQWTAINGVRDDVHQAKETLANLSGQFQAHVTNRHAGAN